ncbi:amino acid transporter [Venturia nashicola]|uniref:Amino acid transporter n=1 Tax=Venturia nashicola TaxID=86259 RepID=A0A4Z1P236_9PEZI|nr:amino acid transporter [Venturia nashicola]TLD18965.1 amino acid transporter [Venturia nashicola]
MEKKELQTERTSSHAEGQLEHLSDHHELELLGYRPELQKNRSMLTLLFQSLAIAAIPYGEGAPLISAIYGGGQLSIFVGWIVVLALNECIALSLGELASKYPTSAGPYYWSFQIAKNSKVVLSFITGWIWLIGNWTITLSVNFGFASLISATVSMYHPDFAPPAWQLLLIFYAICLMTMIICIFGNKYLPTVDMICAAFTAISILIIMIALSVKADVGRHSASYALGHYDTSFSGWGGFTFFIGLLPAAYTFSAIGMISAMAEEVDHPATKVPTAISLCVPVGGIAGLFFIIPICVTLPPLKDIINAPVLVIINPELSHYQLHKQTQSPPPQNPQPKTSQLTHTPPAAQALPYIFHIVMGSPGGGLGLTFLVLLITLFCSISITVAASRCTWAFARDDAIPGASIFSKVHTGLGVPINAIILTTLVQMLLGLINLGSTSAFTAFVSVGVQALAVSYAIPIAISLLNGRRDVSTAKWNCGKILGPVVNLVALVWICFEVVLFSMPTALPVTVVSMNYASVVLVGFMTLAALWYFAYARKVYKGPPESDGIAG